MDVEQLDSCPSLYDNQVSSKPIEHNKPQENKIYSTQKNCTKLNFRTRRNKLLA